MRRDSGDGKSPIGEVPADVGEGLREFQTLGSIFGKNKVNQKERSPTSRTPHTCMSYKKAITHPRKTKGTGATTRA